MVTDRLAVLAGSRFEIEMREAAALLSLLAVSVADTNWLPGFVVVAVKLALDLSALTVRPISTRAERAIPARRATGLRICLVPFLSASRSAVFPRRLRQGAPSRLGSPAPSARRSSTAPYVVLMPCGP